MAKSTQRWRDPFLASGEYTVDAYVLRRLALAKPNLLNGEFVPVPSIDKWEAPTEHSAICGTRNENERAESLRSFEKRLVTAVVGGLFLIGPMWLMVLLNSWRYTSLISTTIFVAAFGILMALFLTDYKDVLASTAAYAAVLVVFVGTSSPAGS
jgi:hypothetical protein